MRRLIPQSAAPRTGMLFLGATVAACFILPLAAQGQNPAQNDSPHTAHAPAQPATSSGSLADQLRELQSKVAALEAALAQRHQATAAHTSQQGRQAMMPMRGMSGGPMQGMGMQGMGMQGMGTMGRGMMGDSMGMMSGMPMMSKQRMPGMEMDGMGMANMQGMSGMGMGMMNRDGMSMMGRMRSAKQSQMTSALPGFPGASHIYHIGATGFFLDHPEHITLSAEQQVALNRIKEQTLLEQATSERRIEEVEQDLWKLTASDQPDAAKIESKVREIEKLQGDQRLAFIRAVGEAAKLLTDEQRKSLLGTGAGEHPDKQDGR